MSYNLTCGYEGAVQMDAARCFGRGITPDMTQSREAKLGTDA